MTITLLLKNVYGRDLFYPVCDKAVIFAQIAGKKTLDKQHLVMIQSLGFEIVWEANIPK